MRIALVNPTYWPEVRRGTERLMHDLAVKLAERGHRVTILAAHPGRPRRFDDRAGFEVVLDWRPPAIGPLAWYEDHVADSPRVAWRLLRGDFDVAQTFHPATAWAATWARRRGGPPVVAALHGIPARKFLVSRRYRLDMTAAGLQAAEQAAVLSEAAVAATRRYLQVDPVVLPGGVLLDRFAAHAPRTEQPTVVCAASLGDPRKRGALLIEAFTRLRQRRPDAELVLVRTRDPHLSHGTMMKLPEGARWVEADETAELAGLYASAWTSVLPAIDEAFGLVLLESLAAGTPVVAARSGAVPEVIQSDSVGRLFEPDDAESLGSALEAGLELAARDGVADACRAVAARFDWDRVVLDYERVYRLATGLDGNE